MVVGGMGIAPTSRESQTRMLLLHQPPNMKKTDRTGWIRTSSLLDPNQALCQIELRSAGWMKSGEDGARTRITWGKTGFRITRFPVVAVRGQAPFGHDTVHPQPSCTTHPFAGRTGPG